MPEQQDDLDTQVDKPRPDGRGFVMLRRVAGRGTRPDAVIWLTQPRETAGRTSCPPSNQRAPLKVRPRASCA